MTDKLKNQELVPAINLSMQLELKEDISEEELRSMLTDHINHLIRSDFRGLVSILYRIDVSESKLKQMLKENANKDAAAIIADLVIERQSEKIRSRQGYRRDENISDAERW